ncbi:J domain-containing protein [Bacillus sp. DX1.1]|uniref:J domain-containing protein n=1 Tax=unclassified Bacillus (in: firmicutes) TaxID=185979 RepID=UPI00256FBF52|nr:MULTISPECIES: J domain-containing protein [unclassified Bacillus (in: firmicutes)]MDM5152765.1 J domain-containing protein [Bacillus sp. DX1.1]WJE84341.1 J domain-containing protein [Bacillus sp. DX3.1]
MEDFIDYYAILGIPFQASTEEVKTAYRKQAKRHHPDMGGSQGDFLLVKEAYDTLHDPYKRGQYDVLWSLYYAEMEEMNERDTKPYSSPRTTSTSSVPIRFRWKPYVVILCMTSLVIIMLNIVNATKDESVGETETTMQDTHAVSDETNDEEPTDVTATPDEVSGANGEEEYGEEVWGGDGSQDVDSYGFPPNGIHTVTYDETSQIPNADGLQTFVKSVVLTNASRNEDIGRHTNFLGKPMIKVRLELRNYRDTIARSNIGKATLHLNNGTSAHSELKTSTFYGTVSPGKTEEVEVLFFPDVPIDLQEVNHAKLTWSDPLDNGRRYYDAYYVFHF